MIISKTIYRYMVLVSLTANMIWTFFRDLFWESFDEDMQKLLSTDGYGSTIPGTELIFWVIVIASIISYIGLLLFKRWAVWLLLFLNIGVLILLAPFGGVEISAPIERITKTVFLMVDGALISLAIFSNIRNEFK